MAILVEFNSQIYKEKLAKGLAYHPHVRATNVYGTYLIESEKNPFEDYTVKVWLDAHNNKKAACNCEGGQWGHYCRHIPPVCEFHKPIAAAKKKAEKEAELKAWEPYNKLGQEIPALKVFAEPRPQAEKCKSKTCYAGSVTRDGYCSGCQLDFDTVSLFG